MVRAKLYSNKKETIRHYFIYLPSACINLLLNIPKLYVQISEYASVLDNFTKR